MPAAVLAGDRLRPVHETKGSSPLRGLRVLSLPKTLEDERTESYLRIWRTLRRLHAAMPACDAARASASKEPAGVA